MNLLKIKKVTNASKVDSDGKYFAELLRCTKEEILNVVIKIKTLDITKIENTYKFIEDIEKLKELESLLRNLSKITNIMYTQKSAEITPRDEITSVYYNYNRIVYDMYYFMCEINSYLIDRIPIHFETYNWIKEFNNDNELVFWYEATSK